MRPGRSSPSATPCPRRSATGDAAARQGGRPLSKSSQDIKVALKAQRGGPPHRPVLAGRPPTSSQPTSPLDNPNLHRESETGPRALSGEDVGETAETVPTPNAGSSRNRRMSTSDLDTPGRPEREASVRPLVVVVPHIFVEDTFEVASTPEQRPVQALLPHGSYPPLRDRVGVRRLDRRRDGPDAVGSEDIVERAGELAVAVTNQEPRCPARVQGVVATLPCWIKNRWSLRASAGVLQPRVLRGRLLRAAATAARSPAVCLLRSVPLGKYCRSRSLVFSLVPRCQGLCGSQK